MIVTVLNGIFVFVFQAVVTNLYTKALTGGSSGSPDFDIELRVSSDNSFNNDDPVEFELVDAGGCAYWDGIEAADSVVVDIQGKRLHCDTFNVHCIPNVKVTFFFIGTFDLFNAMCEQVCIPVGCVPPACWSYLPACTAPAGMSAPGGVYHFPP